MTPIHIGGKNPSDVAGFLNRIALSLLIAGSDANYGQQLKNGTFDWSNFNQVSEFVLELKDKGFFNVDHLTSDKQGTYNGLAKNEVAFAFQSNKSIYEVLKVNPDAQVTMMRLPSEDGEPFLISGERNAIGVWKDTPHEEEALAFLEFMSKPEHVRAVAETYYLPAAIEGVKVDLGDLEDVFNKYEDARVFHHFDREYLPNGMWGTLKVVGPGVLSKEMNIEQASKIMKEDYERLRNENK